jgi:hypothetical protein
MNREVRGQEDPEVAFEVRRLRETLSTSDAKVVAEHLRRLGEAGLRGAPELASMIDEAEPSVADPIVVDEASAWLLQGALAEAHRDIGLTEPMLKLYASCRTLTKPTRVDDSHGSGVA